MKVPGWLKDTRNRGILAAIGVLLVIVLYTAYHSSPVVVPPVNIIISSSTPLFDRNSSATSTPATSQKPSATSTPKTTKATSIASVPAASIVVPNIPAQELTASGAQLLKSLVNIICISGNPSIPSISGSGVIIDPRGIIITAAHVAQFFLLQDYLGSDKVECLVRTGSPARRAYFAEPIYVSPTWVADNPTTLTTASPKGTGENDFAFLAITATATSTPLPDSFPFVPLAQNDPQLQEQVAIGSYGAQYLTATELNYDLYPILVFGAIQNEYTFNTDTVDLISVLGSAASQEGSSGGGIADANGQLAGIITTSSIGGDIATRSLNAITLGHIRRSYFADTGANLDAVLENNSLPTLISSFANESKILGAALMSDISSK